MGEISLTKIIDLVNVLRQKIERYRVELSSNEMLTRYVLIDPFLRALGWDLDDPEQVVPEPRVEGERPDYALKIAGKIVAFIEAKPLGGITDEAVKEKLKYSFDAGVRYTIITDGDTWIVFDAFKQVPWKEKKISEWSITGEKPSDIAIKSLIIANIASFGEKIQGPAIAPETSKPPPSPMQGGYSVEKVMGPLTKPLAKQLVLKILASARKPLGRKEIVEEVSKMIELTPQDLERTKWGLARWEAEVRWAVTELKGEGLIKSIARNQWIITEKGLEKLKKEEV
ncbi:MAG: winged helix-turn-helix domain-containing protein [Sulfolobales archaeon]